MFKRSFFVLAAVLAVKLYLVRYLLFGGDGALGFAGAEIGFAVAVAAIPTGRRARGIRGVLITDAVVSVLLMAVLVFHNYFNRVPSWQALALVGQVGEVHASVSALFNPRYLLFLVDLPLLWAVARLRPTWLLTDVRSRVRRGMVAAGITAMLVNVVMGYVQPVPDFSLAAERYGIANAEITDWSSRSLVHKAEAGLGDPTTLQARIEELEGGPGPKASAEDTAALKGRNVILIVAESLQTLAVGRTVDGQPVTPNIDALAKDGRKFTNVFSEVSAGNTSDAEFVINTSLYPLESAAMSRDFGDRRFPSLPRLLKDAGYATMTFHPNDVTFWSRDKLYPALGFDEIHDKKFYGGGSDVVGLGSSDEVLFEKALPVLKAKASTGKPFYAAFVTLTSHHPFKIPAEKQHLKLPSALKGTLVGDYLVAENYTDYAVGRFVDGLKKAGIYDESVIVVVGDHFGLQPSEMDDADRAAITSVLGRPYTDVDRFNVPLVIATPGAGGGAVSDKTASQLDVLPTLSSMMGLPYRDQVHLGRDLTASESQLIGLRYYAPAGTYADEKTLYFARTASSGDAYDLRTHLPVKARPADAAAKSDRIVTLEKLSDAYVKTLPKR